MQSSLKQVFKIVHIILAILETYLETHLFQTSASVAKRLCGACFKANNLEKSPSL
jgi:hypothetical protein